MLYILGEFVYLLSFLTPLKPESNFHVSGMEYYEKCQLVDISHSLLFK